MQFRNNLKYIRFLLIGLILFGLSLVVALKAPNNFFHAGSTTVDSSVFIYMGRVILNGGMPYRDYFDHKGPVLFLINALGVYISPTWGVWLLDCFAFFVTFVMIYRIARFHCNRFFSITVVLASTYDLFRYYIEANGTEVYAMPFIAIATYIFLDYFLHEKIGTLRLMICGLSFCAVFLLRANMIAVWMVMCIGVFLQCIMKRELVKIGYFLKWFLVGAGLLCVPIAFWLGINGAISEFIDDYFIFNIIYSGSSDIVDKITALFYFFSIKSILFCSVLVAIMCAVKKDLLHWLYAVLFVASLVMMNMSGWKSDHYAMVLVPLAAYPFSFAVKCIQDGVEQNDYKSLVIAMMICTGSVLPPWISAIEEAVCEDFVNWNENCVLPSHQAIVDLIQQNTTKEDQIIVIGNYNLYYNLSDRFAASQYSYQFPIIDYDLNKYGEFFDELYESVPKMVVINSHYESNEHLLEFLDSFPYRDISHVGTDGVKVFLLDS